jgi:hypothetical protein
MAHRWAVLLCIALTLFIASQAEGRPWSLSYLTQTGMKRGSSDCGTLHAVNTALTSVTWPAQTEVVFPVGPQPSPELNQIAATQASGQLDAGASGYGRHGPPRNEPGPPRRDGYGYRDSRDYKTGAITMQLLPDAAQPGSSPLQQDTAVYN